MVIVGYSLHGASSKGFHIDVELLLGATISNKYISSARKLEIYLTIVVGVVPVSIQYMA